MSPVPRRTQEVGGNNQDDEYVILDFRYGGTYSYYSQSSSKGDTEFRGIECCGHWLAVENLRSCCQGDNKGLTELLRSCSR